MWHWLSRRPIEEPLTLVQRISKLETRITLLDAEIMDLATAQDILRNKVLRKIQGRSRPEQLEEEEGKPKDLYGGVLLPTR